MEKPKRPEPHIVYENFTGTKREHEFWKKLWGDNMKKQGQVTYELSEEEFNKIKQSIRDIRYYFDHNDYKEDAEYGISKLEEIFEG